MRMCLVCKNEIEADRLDAIPETRLCIAHGREIQKHGGEFSVTASQERTSKQGSLKHNYGGVSTSSVRNQVAIAKLVDEYEASRFDNQ